jgi:hypothetical protein
VPESTYQQLHAGADPSRIPRGAAMDMHKAEWTSIGVRVNQDDMGGTDQGYGMYRQDPGQPPFVGPNGLALDVNVMVPSRTMGPYHEGYGVYQ